MNERHLLFSFLISGHINQDIVITDPTIDMDDVADMFNNTNSQNSSLLTSLQEGADILLLKDGDLTTVGYVVDSEPEAEYSDFGGDETYEIDTPNKYFNMTQLAYGGAVGEFIYEPKMSTSEITEHLIEEGNNETSLAVIEEKYRYMPASKLLLEIKQTIIGLENLMQVAYDAGKQGKEII